jgi:hypothetical protein
MPNPVNAQIDAGCLRYAVQLKITEFRAMTVIQIPTLKLRKSVRYVRNDIDALLYSARLFRSSTPFEIELLDISTRGAHIASKRKLNVNAAYILKLTFKDGETFEISGKVVHKNLSAEGSYGFQFNAYQDELGNHLLKTQTELIFKDP